MRSNILLWTFSSGPIVFSAIRTFLPNKSKQQERASTELNNKVNKITNELGLQNITVYHSNQIVAPVTGGVHGSFFYKPRLTLPNKYMQQKNYDEFKVRKALMSLKYHDMLWLHALLFCQNTLLCFSNKAPQKYYFALNTLLISSFLGWSVILLPLIEKRRCDLEHEYRNKPK